MSCKQVRCPFYAVCIAQDLRVVIEMLADTLETLTNETLQALLDSKLSHCPYAPFDVFLERDSNPARIPINSSFCSVWRSTSKTDEMICLAYIHGVEE